MIILSHLCYHVSVSGGSMFCRHSLFSPQHHLCEPTVPGEAIYFADVQSVLYWKEGKKIPGGVNSVRKTHSPPLHVSWLLCPLATRLQHLCVVNKNNLKVLGCRQGDARDSKHLRGFVTKATSCLLAAKGHKNDGSLWKMNSATTTKKSASKSIGWGGEKGIFGPGKRKANQAL